MVDFDDYGGFITRYDQLTTELVKCPSHATGSQWREFFGQTQEVWPIVVPASLAGALVGFAPECFVVVG